MTDHRAVLNPPIGEDSRATDAPAREQLLVAGTAASSVGAAIAAAFAALCCVGPWAVALLGVSGAIAAASLAPYRPLFLLASLAVLAFGFWRAYGRQTLVAGRVCRVRVGRFSRVALWSAAAIWLLAALLPAG